MKKYQIYADRIILDLCGGTGAWSLPYKEAGYDVRNTWDRIKMVKIERLNELLRGNETNVVK